MVSKQVERTKMFNLRRHQYLDADVIRYNVVCLSFSFLRHINSDSLGARTKTEVFTSDSCEGWKYLECVGHYSFMT